MIRRWFVGFVVFVGYLCLGAFVFYRIERKEEEKRHYLEILERLELKELLAKHYTQVNPHVRKQFVQQLNEYCNKTVLLDEEPDEKVHQYQWTYYNAFFFALTTLSTIGYGNLHPTSATGRILVLVYSLIGIPLNGIVLTQLGSFFESRNFNIDEIRFMILRAHYSYKTQRMMGPQLSLIVDIITYLIPGIIVFIFIPSGIISYFEQWTFDESVYFAFVTLTTIGYGDYVAGQTVSTNIWYNAYKVFLVFWIMFGLGYLFMILSFISRAMRSKTLEHLFLERLKHTHSKIWHQFTKDVVHIRRVLNESYLLKFKPVYKQEASSCDQPLRRSRSAPNLSEWPVMRKVMPAPTTCRTSEDEDEEVVRQRFEKHRMKRRRALSQNKMRSLLRRTKATSEIDLAHIDKEATFGADIASYEILSRVVDALETAVPNQPTVHQPNDAHYSKKKAFSFSEGVQGFSSDDILASEKNEWTIGGDMLNREHSFAAKHGNSYFEYDTWGGVDDRNFKKLNNEYAKNDHGGGGVGGGGYQPQYQQQKPRVPKLRRMSAAAFNFLSNNIAPKWLADKLADGGGDERSANNPKHRLSLNDDHGYGYGYGSTYNGTVNNTARHNRNHSYNPNHTQNGYNHHNHYYNHGGYNNGNGNNGSQPHQFCGRPLATYSVQQPVPVTSQQPTASSVLEQPRHRRLSSPDPVLAHCANTIAVADFLMTLQRSLDNSSATMQPYGAYFPRKASATGRLQERRSPLFTLFQDRRTSSSAESWQYSSLTSTMSASTNDGGGGKDCTAADVIAVDRLLQPSSTIQLHPMSGTINAVQEPMTPTTTEGLNSCCRETVPAKKPKKKRVRRFSIRPTITVAPTAAAATMVVAAPELTAEELSRWTITTNNKGCRDVRLNIED